MKQVRVYCLDLQSVSVGEKHLFCDLYFTLRCGELLLISEMCHTTKSFTELGKNFEVLPRTQKDWSIQIECWDYNSLTQGQERALVGSALLDLSALLPGSQSLFKLALLNASFGMKEVDLNISIQYMKESTNMILIDPNKPSKDREVQRIRHMIKVEEQSNNNKPKVETTQFTPQQQQTTTTETTSKKNQSLMHLPVQQYYYQPPPNRQIRSRTPEMRSHSPMNYAPRNQSPYNNLNKTQQDQYGAQRGPGRVQMPPQYQQDSHLMRVMYSQL